MHHNTIMNNFIWIMFRPLTSTDMQSIISRTYDLQTNQLISPSICSPVMDSSIYAQNPEYYNSRTSCYFNDGASYSTCSAAASTSSSRRFCPCSVSKSIFVRNMILLLSYFSSNCADHGNQVDTWT